MLSTVSICPGEVNHACLSGRAMRPPFAWKIFAEAQLMEPMMKAK